MASTTIATERRAARFWWFFIFALMGINLAMAVAAIVLSAGDPSFRPMPEYGEHAVDWQSRKTQLEASSRLGWQLEVERQLGASHGQPHEGSSPKPASVRFRLRDAHGAPIVGATGTLGAYHLTRVSEFRTADFEPIEGDLGGYEAGIDVSRDGKWQLSIDLRDGNGQAFVWQQVVDWSSP
ncbi:MAG: FixH family protein [Pirellula sp.]